jgi:hypothetical protein
MSEPYRNARVIRYFGEPMKVGCDAQCQKAWGITSRPRIVFDDLDDYVFLADDELGEAPADPGTYEGPDGKPLSPDEFPNKWCVRQCERCAKSAMGRWMEPLTPRDWSQRAYNQPYKHPEVSHAHP